MTIDLDEIDDRLEEIQDQIEQMENFKDNEQILKVNITVYSVEKAKILSLIYKYRQIRSVRENQQMMENLQRQEEDMWGLH